MQLQDAALQGLGLLYFLALQGVGAITAEEEDLAVVEEFNGLVRVFMDILDTFRFVGGFDDFACKVTYLGRHFHINDIFLIRRTIELVMPYEIEGKVVETGADTGYNEI